MPLPYIRSEGEYRYAIDMEGSTALTQRLGDAAAQDILRSHNTVVRDALKAHGGSEIKHTGDGIMASFTFARAVLDCAIAIQQGFGAPDRVGAGLAPTTDASSSNDTKPARPDAADPIRVRIGLNAGEPVAEDRDLFGAAVQLAARAEQREAISSSRTSSASSPWAKASSSQTSETSSPKASKIPSASTKSAGANSGPTVPTAAEQRPFPRHPERRPASRAESRISAKGSGVGQTPRARVPSTNDSSRSS